MKSNKAMQQDILYFYPMGMDFDEEYKPLSDVGNHRIRTSFITCNGYVMFVEFSPGKGNYGKGKQAPRLSLILNYAHSHTRNSDSNKSSYRCREIYDHCKELDYTKANILHIVNTYLGGNFKAVEVMSWYEDYDPRSDTPMEYYAVNPARAEARRQAVEAAEEELRRKTGERYPVVIVKERDDKGLLLRDGPGNTWRVEVPYCKEVRQ